MTTIYFASNRDVLHETSTTSHLFGERFNQLGPQCFRVGEANVDYAGDDPKIDGNWTVGAGKLYPENLQDRNNKPATYGSARLFEGLRKLLKGGDCDVIAYIPGFANTFENSLQRAAALQELYNSEKQRVIVVLFSWPSNGEVAPAWNYFSDREDAEASGLAMGRALLRLVEFLTEMRAVDRETVVQARRIGQVPKPEDLRQCTQRLHLLAHSMGNWAFRHALRKFSDLNGGHIPRVIDCAFLMAADEDNDALQERLKLRRLEELANRTFVYHAANDIALTISDTTKGLPDRLGSDGPKNLDLVSERVFAIDCRKVSETALLDGRHQYYRLRDEVIEDIRLTLDDQPQEDRSGRIVVRPGRSWRLQPR
ncbi:alpha/beta hydrolase [Jiella endophytica]|uniref:Alpha/beta hydrolase n=1 Tax=Jiella endophytica TaxID=2558362 RepID=A0A4Y8RGR3_9HYPH|nr:alpha/beta hydrolase [Jiella endophytica]TFF21943.1 alpha/beta hydrolase [Jiella endophytica]